MANVGGMCEGIFPETIQLSDLLTRKVRFPPTIKPKFADWNEAGPHCFFKLWFMIPRNEQSIINLPQWQNISQPAFPPLNTTNRPFICWHTAPGHSWKQDVLLLLFKLHGFMSGSQPNFKNRCYVAERLNWPQQWEAISLELDYSLLAGGAIKDAFNWKQEQPKVYYCLRSVTAYRSGKPLGM